MLLHFCLRCGVKKNSARYQEITFKYYLSHLFPYKIFLNLSFYSYILVKQKDFICRAQISSWDFATLLALKVCLYAVGGHSIWKLLSIRMVFRRSHEKPQNKLTFFSTIAYIYAFLLLSNMIHTKSMIFLWLHAISLESFYYWVYSIFTNQFSGVRAVLFAYIAVFQHKFSLLWN